MNKDTEIVLILDKSGSMASCRNDTIGGLNVFVEEQKKDGLPTRLTFVQFDSEVWKIFISRDIQEVTTFTERDFIPGGGTALLDAIGTTVDELDVLYKDMLPGDRPNIMVAIMTDGEENQSHKYTQGHIKALVEGKTAQGWSFVFLSASLSAFSVGASYGVTHTASVSTQNMEESMRLYSRGTTLFKSARSVQEVTSSLNTMAEAQTANYMANEGKGFDPSVFSEQVKKALREKVKP